MLIAFLDALPFPRGEWLLPLCLVGLLELLASRAFQPGLGRLRVLARPFLEFATTQDQVALDSAAQRWFCGDR